MRLKEFAIFIVIFTIVYIIFFILFDKISNKHGKSKMVKNAKKIININSYILYSRFYGFNTNLNYDNLIQLFQDLNIEQMNSVNLLDIANKYNTNNYEIAVVVSYFEMLGLLKRRSILLHTNTMIENTPLDQNLLSKYLSYFQSKKTFDEIKSALGEDVYTELNTINEKFMYPGLRFIDKVIYYYEGDSNA